jgi:hypothetical protein
MIDLLLEKIACIKKASSSQNRKKLFYNLKKSLK